MAVKKVNESPSIADQVLFELATPDSEGCFLANPYQIDSVIIYFVERNFTSTNYAEMVDAVKDSSLQEDLVAATKTACDDPTEENLAQVAFLKNEIELTSKRTTSYYSASTVVKQYGGENNPAWLSTGDPESYEVENVPEDSSGDLQYGHFQLLWNPLGMRSGDYLIYWTWTPYESSPLTKLTNFISFSLQGATQLTTSIPTHFTKPEKYETLQERFLPETYKMTLSDLDLSPYVFQELNNSVAKGFTFIEDMSNQMVDIIDANATHETLLSLLAGLFRLSLRSSDPTMWRRQIKRAIPLFKKKGTLRGLNEALEQAGITLKKFTRLWQVVSPYTYQELFDITSDYETEFYLSKLAILPTDGLNFELFYRPASTDDVPLPDWQTLSVSDYITFVNVDGITTMTWIGDTAPDPIILMSGDSVRVIYKIETVGDQTIENHIRNLSLADQRDEREQDYPLKNWNVRVMDEDDAMFDSVIPDKNPFYDPIVYGKIRTEFPYSENIYNMEEYNGSKRDSTDPCDIDKDFMDECSGGISSKFNLDIEIEDISNERVLEANEIIKEYKPFHAQLHTLNILGGIDEYVPPQVEQIDLLGLIDRTDITLTDPVQTIFSRIMELNNFGDDMSPSWRRNSLASFTTVGSGNDGFGQNLSIMFYSPNVGIKDFLPDNMDPTIVRTLLEVIDGTNAGYYSITNPVGNYAEIYTPMPPEPIDSTVFTFRLSKEVFRQDNFATIEQDNIFYFYDETVDWVQIPIRTQKDVDDGLATNPYQIRISGNDYPISYIMPDGRLVLEDDGTLPGPSTVTYYLIDDSGDIVFTSATGDLTVKYRGKVTFTASGPCMVYDNSFPTSSITNIRNYIKIGYYARLQDDSQYYISGFGSGVLSFYIDDYDAGISAGQTVIVYNRVIDGQSGYFNYRGMKLTTTTDYETSLGIHETTPDPQPDDSYFRENFLIYIGNDYYTISSINGTEIIINGPMVQWETTGTPNVEYTIYQFDKELSPPAHVDDRKAYAHLPGYDFASIDRRGKEIIEYTVETITPLSMMMMSEMLNAPIDDEPTGDMTKQKESITFTVKWINEGEK